MPFASARQAPQDRVQRGVHFRPGEKPPDLWALVLIDVAAGATASQASQAIRQIWTLVDDLTRGRVPELQDPLNGTPVEVPTGNLHVAIGYGSRIFGGSIHKPALVPIEKRPSEVGALLRSGPNQPFPRLNWAPGADAMSGQADLVVQLTADTDLAVARAIVEINRLIAVEKQPLLVKQLFRGFHRDDRRSWIGFHDGVNNLDANDRADTVPIVVDVDQPWTVGGTYMSFMKIAADLDVWRALPRKTQEAIVGRDKSFGVPVTGISQSSQGLAIEIDGQCPFRPLGPDPQSDPIVCVDPTASASAVVHASHVGRSNFNRGAAREPANNRIYRQGYEFMDADKDGRLTVGLNFVAFVREPSRVRRILRLPDWLGDANFGGGKGGISDPQLMSVLAAGFYALPPLPAAGSGEEFPGQSLFGEVLIA
jgi:Dyp-type peroxidase family